MTPPAVPFCPVPGPRGVPLLGNLPAFCRDPLPFLVHLRDSFGDAVTWSFGPRRSLFISHPTHIGELLGGIGQSYRRAAVSRSLKQLVGDSVLSSEGTDWRRKRFRIQPVVRPRQVRGYSAAMVDCAVSLADRWQGGQRIDVMREMHLVTQRIVARTLFGNDIGKQADALSTALSEATEEIGSEMRSIRYLLPPWLHTPVRRRMRTATAAIETEIYRLIRERQSARDGADLREDLLSRLLAARDEDGCPLSAKEARDEAVTLWFAGQGTTATALTWVWHLLSANPAVRATLTEELDQVLDGRAPTSDDYERLTWTQGVVKETLRLYPPAWLLASVAQDGASLGGVPVRPGTTVWYSPWSLHRDPRWFSDPTVFRPERWDPNAPDTVPHHAWIPFGGGPRACVGARFAIVEIVLVVATLAQRFDIDIDPGEVAPTAGMMLTPNRTLGATLRTVSPPTVDH